MCHQEGFAKLMKGREPEAHPTNERGRSDLPWLPPYLANLPCAPLLVNHLVPQQTLDRVKRERLGCNALLRLNLDVRLGKVFIVMAAPIQLAAP